MTAERKRRQTFTITSQSLNIDCFVIEYKGQTRTFISVRWCKCSVIPVEGVLSTLVDFFLKSRSLKLKHLEIVPTPTSSSIDVLSQLLAVHQEPAEGC